MYSLRCLQSLYQRAHSNLDYLVAQSILAPEPVLRTMLARATVDLQSATRAAAITFSLTPGPDFEAATPGIWLQIR